MQDLWCKFMENKVKVLKSFKSVKRFYKVSSAAIVHFLLITFFLSFTVNAQDILSNVDLSAEERQWISEHPILTATNNMDLVPLDFVRDCTSSGKVGFLSLYNKRVFCSIC